MRIAVIAISLTLAASLQLACYDPPLEDPAYDEKLDEWQAERDAHGEVGVEASFALGSSRRRRCARR